MDLLPFESAQWNLGHQTAFITTKWQQSKNVLPALKCWDQRHFQVIMARNLAATEMTAVCSFLLSRAQIVITVCLITVSFKSTEGRLKWQVSCLHVRNKIVNRLQGFKATIMPQPKLCNSTVFKTRNLTITDKETTAMQFANKQWETTNELTVES